MKKFIRSMLVLAVVVAVPQWNDTASAQLSPAGAEIHSVLTIKPDSTCVLVTETIESRAVAEQQVRMMERYQKMSEATDEEEGGTNSATGAETAPTPLTDTNLVLKILEMSDERSGENAEDPDQKLDVEVNKDKVRTTTTRSFASLEEMLRNSYAIWNQSGLAVGNTRVEIDTNGLLRLTLTPRADMQRYLKNFRAEWKLTGAKTELRLVFPGRVVASGFPEAQTNATWLAIDAKKDETIEAVIKLYSTPVVITAEAGGLKLAGPLESKNLRRSFGRQHGETGDELPITNAAPGFVAEAQSITTTTLRVFPGGESYFKSGGGYSGQSTGTVVYAKLFAPKGRTLQSVNDVKVLQALDDKGRSVMAEPAEGEDDSSATYSGGSPDANSMPIQLRLQLPQPDAQAIDKISAEAIAVTAGNWKEMTLTNIQENSTNEIDLAGVLPGAKLVITKFTSKNNQLNLQARIKGPTTVRRLDIQAKIRGSDDFRSYLSEGNFSTKNGESTRTVAIQGYGFGDDANPEAGSLVVVVRYPEDLRRERLMFELKALDLL